MIARILLGSVAFELRAAQRDTPMTCDDAIMSHLLSCSSFCLLTLCVKRRKLSVVWASDLV